MTDEKIAAVVATLKGEAPLTSTTYGDLGEALAEYQWVRRQLAQVRLHMHEHLQCWTQDQVTHIHDQIKD